MLPLVITLFIYSSFSKQSQITKAQQTTEQSLALVNDSLNISLENATYQRNLLTGAPRLMTSLKKILTRNAMNYSDVVFTDSIKLLINISINSNLNIHSVYLSIDNADRFFSSDNGIQSIDKYKDKQWHTIYSSHSKETKTWTCRRTYYEYGRPVQLVSIFLRLINARGVIVVNLYPDRLQSMVNQTFFNQKESVFLLNSENQILLSNDAGSNDTDFFENSLSNQLFYDKMDALKPTKIRVEGNTYYVTFTPESEYGFRLLSLIKEQDYYTLSSYLNATFMIMAICAIIMSLALSLYVTYKNVFQFYYIFDILNDAEQGRLNMLKHPKYLMDEFSLIINNVIKMFVKNENLKNELTEKQHMKTKTELTALQLQINPHFLFNSLQLLDNQAYSMTNQYTELNTTIQKLSSILKYTLASPQEAVTLREDLHQIHSYADINYKRYPDMFILYFDYEEETLDNYVFRLLLQPLIENSLYHGIRPLNHSRGGLIKLKIYCHDGYLHFYILDNGIGIEKEHLKRLRLLLNSTEINTGHIGLTNTNSRLLLYFGEESKIHIMSKAGYGTILHFKIPQISAKEDIKITF
jgi:two-component system sensor histidine kinase YesM